MELYTIDHGYRYELENICRLFFPFEKINVSDRFESESAFDVYTSVKAEQGGSRFAVSVRRGGFFAEREGFVPDDAHENGSGDELERMLAVALYEIMCALTDMRPQWGILTGVRPGKLMRRTVDALGADGARRYFKEKLLCSDKKIDLCMTASANEEKIIASSEPNDFSLYLSVPFCPTRCSYCSFVSHSVEKSMKLVDEYVGLLCRELEYTGALAKKLGIDLKTVYIGGGTPTTLSAEQLEQVMGAVSANFDLSKAEEYTVEAGRPDTVTREKLLAIKRGGATRISINPQTMNDSVLEVIGRRHTAAQTEAAFALARECGFDNINMDLIAGLPTDTVESFADTLRRIRALDPESVTVHTLSLKRSSRLTVTGDLPEAQAGRTADEMLTLASSGLAQSGYIPYYLYRQSRTVGNLENTGYAKPKKECLYNIFIMDETHSILACGASAVTKLRAPDGYIERVFNFKYPYEYISRFDEMLRRKEAIEKFYNEHMPR